MDEELFQITGDYLVKIFTSKKFISSLNEINKYFGKEAGFTVDQPLFKSKYRISPVMKGGESCVGEAILDPSVPCDFDFSYLIDGDRCTYSLINVHTHPYDKLSIRPQLTPSTNMGDLYSMRCTRELVLENAGIDKFLIEVILAQSKSKPLEIMLIQECYATLHNDAHYFEILNELFKIPSADNEDVAETLRQTEFYKVELIKFDGKGYDEESIRKIRSFEFTPIVVNANSLQEFVEDCARG